MNNLDLIGGRLLNKKLIRGFYDDIEPDEEKDKKSALIFRPQPKQVELLDAAGVGDWYLRGGRLREPRARIIGYGGAVYGGKTYGLLGLAAVCGYAYPNCQIAFFRRTYAQIEGAGGAMNDAHAVFGAVAKKRDAGRTWYFPDTGATFYFQHCEHESDVYNYQSKQIDILLIDQAEHFTWFMIDYLLTRNRATVEGVAPFAVLTANPGNIGHDWYMNLFDLENLSDNMKGGVYEQPLHIRNANNKWVNVFFIPAFMEDNRIGMDRDPDYENRLMERDPDTAQALRYGDWKRFTGQAFREFDRDRHVVEPFEIPAKWVKWRAVDWGWDHPYCCLFFARNPANGRIIVYRELLQSYLTSQEQAFQIAEQTPYTEAIGITWADPSMWASKNVNGIVKSTAQEYIENGIYVIKADNDRVSGVKKIHNALADLGDGEPGLQIFSNCKNLINILPKMVKAEYNSEDVQKMDGDDPFDCLKYGLSNLDIHRGKRRRKPEDEQINPWEALSKVL